MFLSTNPGQSQHHNLILQGAIEDLASEHTSTGDNSIHRRELVISFYQTNGYALAWTNRINTAMLLAVIQCADEEGLNPKEYNLRTIQEYYYRKNLSEAEQTCFDILLTDAFMLYGSHLVWGKVDPDVLYPNEWQHAKREVDLVSILYKALQDRTIANSINTLITHHKGYKKLKEALQFYEKIRLTGGWPVISSGAELDSGMVDIRVPDIRKRLAITRQLQSYSFQDSLLYDSLLVTAIKKFQSQNGLAVDGVVGNNTLASLNLTVVEYIEKIKANLERYRWFGDSLSEKFLMVNVPSFQLTVHENDSVVLMMKAIVGRPDRRTPVLQSDIHYLILNPTWTVPPTILREDALPAIRRSLKYLERNNLRVFNGKGEEVDPAGLPWEKYTERNFPFQLRQDPGPNNSLGLIKFQFPNNHRVFLHDTNHPNLFALTNRALSSGCIRIEHPLALATYLLQGTSWTANQLERKIESGKTVTVMFPQPIPIYLSYFTAFVDDQNTLQIRNDIYTWDEILINNLSDLEVY